MSGNQRDLAPSAERAEYPPLLNLVVPTAMLIASGAYAWSLRNVVNPEMNLLLLKPLFIAIWLFLLVVFIDDVIPSIRMQGAWRAARGIPLRARFAPGTEANAGLVVIATFVFACFGVGHGTVQYVASSFLYLIVTGYLIGDRRPLNLIPQASLCSAALYLVLGFLLGVSF